MSRAFNQPGVVRIADLPPDPWLAPPLHRPYRTGLAAAVCAELDTARRAALIDQLTFLAWIAASFLAGVFVVLFVIACHRGLL
jgi:hypothetical protein